MLPGFKRFECLSGMQTYIKVSWICEIQSFYIQMELIGFFYDIICWPLIIFLAPRKNVTLTYNYQVFFIEIYWILEILCLSGSFILMISMHVCVQFNFIDILWGQSTRSTGLETRQKSSHSESTETSQKCPRLSR